MTLYSEILDESVIIEILKNKEEICRQKRERLHQLRNDMADNELSIITASFPGRSNEISTVSGGYVSDLSDVLIDMYKQEREMFMIMLEEYKAISNLLEKINRVWICFQALPYDTFDVLNRLYVRRELWSALEQDMNHRTVVKRRREGLQKILTLYHCSYQTREIAAMRFIRKGEKDNENIYDKSTVGCGDRGGAEGTEEVK